MRKATSSAAGKQASVKDQIAALKRERIVAAAVDLFYEQGYENATLEAVADSMAVTKPFIYGQFGSKTDLLAEICAHGIRRLLAAIESAPTALSPTERLRWLARQAALVILENRRQIAISTREEKNLDPAQLKAINDMRRDFGRRLAGLLETGAKSGEFTLADARLTSLAIGGMLSWTYVWFDPDGRFHTEQVSDMLTDLILAMVQAKPVSAARRVSRKTVRK